MFYTCICGAGAQLAMQYCVSLDYGSTVSCFIGALVLAVLAEFGSRAGKDATTIFIIPGIIPLVPGALLYNSMMELLSGDLTNAANLITTTITTSLSIAAALVVVSSITRLIVSISRRISKFIHAHKKKKPPADSGDSVSGDSDPSNSSVQNEDSAPNKTIGGDV